MALLTIRRQQLDALAAERLVGFKSDLLQRVQREFFGTCQALGAQASQDLVAHAVTVCLARGLTSPATVTRAIDSLFRHGDRVVSDSAAALHAVLLELQAQDTCSLLETLQDGPA